MLLLTAYLLPLTSCKTQQRIVEKEKLVYKTEYKNRVQLDSVYLHDSVYIHQRNDTVFFSKWKTAYKYKYLTDTLRRTDSIYIDVPYLVEVPKVEYRQNNWQIVKSWFGGLTLIFLSLFGIWKFIKWKFFK